MGDLSIFKKCIARLFVWIGINIKNHLYPIPIQETGKQVFQWGRPATTSGKLLPSLRAIFTRISWWSFKDNLAIFTSNFSHLTNQKTALNPTIQKWGLKEDFKGAIGWTQPPSLPKVQDTEPRKKKRLDTFPWKYWFLKQSLLKKLGSSMSSPYKIPRYP